jgi:hypothetical protein
MRTITMGRSLATMRGSGFRLPIPSFPGLLHLVDKISRKLQARWEGPYRITRKVSPVLYEAIIDGVKKRVHAINMKPKAMIRIKHKDTVIEDKGMSEVME